jgi:hypothetical protein
MVFGWKDVKRQEVLDLLAGVKDLFADKDKWLLVPKAEDKNKQSTDPLNDQAVRWNLLGAGEKVAAGLFAMPHANYVECASRELLDRLSDGKAIHGMSWDDEYALICLAHEWLETVTEGEIDE